MNVILKQTINKLGKVGSVVSVKPGYARNFLVPKDMAEVATAENIARLEDELSQLRAAEEKLVSKAEKIKEKVEHFCQNIVIEMNVTEEGQLYGSVSMGDVVMMIKDQLGKEHKDFELSKQMVHLNEGAAIKSAGEFSGNLQLHTDVSCPIHLTVVAVTG